MRYDRIGGNIFCAIISSTTARTFAASNCVRPHTHARVYESAHLPKHTPEQKPRTVGYAYEKPVASIFEPLTYRWLCCSSSLSMYGVSGVLVIPCC